MRAYKFRGWHPLENKWVYGGVHFTDDDAMIIERRKGNDCFHSEVVFDSVGQFTGLLDKNGVEIFEGDVVRYEWLNTHLDPTIFIGEVRWAKWCYHLYREGALSKVLDTISINSRKAIVIGNIYEHPQWLERE